MKGKGRTPTVWNYARQMLAYMKEVERACKGKSDKFFAAYGLNKAALMKSEEIKKIEELLKSEK